MSRTKKVRNEPAKRLDLILKELKKSYRISAKDLAKEGVFVSEQYLSQLRNEQKNITDIKATEICEAIKKLTNGQVDIDSTWLLGYDNLRNEKERQVRNERHMATVERIRTNAAEKTEAIRHIYALLGFMGYSVKSVYVLNWADMVNALRNAPGGAKGYMPHNIDQYNSLREWAEGEKLSQDDLSLDMNFISQKYAGVMYCITTPSGATRIICRDDFSAMIVGIKNTAAALIESGIERTGLHCFLSPVVLDDIPINEFPAYPNMMN